MRGLQRVVASVNLMVSTALSTHSLLTLCELESFILGNNKDFAEIASFDALKLGPLYTHPEWQRACPSTRPPSVLLTSAEVIQHLAAAQIQQDKTAEGQEERPAFSPVDALNDLAATHGHINHKELGIFLRADAWVTFVVNRGRSTAKRATSAQSKLVRQIDKEHARTLAKLEASGALDENDLELLDRLKQKLPKTSSETGGAVAEAVECYRPVADPLEPDFVLQLRRWAAAPVSVGSILHFSGFRSDERKHVYGVIEADPLLCTLYPSSSGPKSDRVLTIKRTTPTAEPSASAATNLAPPGEAAITDDVEPFDAEAILAQLRNLYATTHAPEPIITLQTCHAL